MIKRVQKILKKYDLSPSQFADQIQIQRSGISHILSGRNKPSLDFVMKTLKAFPDVNADWLIFGNGEMLKLEIDNKNQQQEIGINDNYNNSAKEGSDRKIPLNKLGDNEIDRIIIFYKDQTFEEFNSK